jgi:hypothetical protein
MRVVLRRPKAPGCSRIRNHSSSDSLQSLHVQHDPVGESREDCVPSEAFHSTRVPLAMGTELWTRASGMPRDEGKPPSPHFNNHGAGFMPDPRWQVLAFLPNLSLHPEGAFASEYLCICSTQDARFAALTSSARTGPRPRWHTLQDMVWCAVCAELLAGPRGCAEGIPARRCLQSFSQYLRGSDCYLLDGKVVERRTTRSRPARMISERGAILLILRCFETTACCGLSRSSSRLCISSPAA